MIWQFHRIRVILLWQFQRIRVVLLWQFQRIRQGASSVVPTDKQAKRMNAFLIVSKLTLIPELFNCLVGLVVKVSASRAEGPRFESLRRDFYRVESYQWLKNWHSNCYLAKRLASLSQTLTGWPGVSILWLGEMESLVCNFYLSVSGRKIVWANPSLRYTGM